jgi:hypothetical protein
MLPSFIQEALSLKCSQDTELLEKFLVVFISLSRQMVEWYLKVGHDYFHPHLF